MAGSAQHPVHPSARFQQAHENFVRDPYVRLAHDLMHPGCLKQALFVTQASGGRSAGTSASGIWLPNLLHHHSTHAAFAQAHQHTPPLSCLPLFVEACSTCRSCSFCRVLNASAPCQPCPACLGVSCPAVFCPALSCTALACNGPLGPAPPCPVFHVQAWPLNNQRSSVLCKGLMSRAILACCALL